MVMKSLFMNGSLKFQRDLKGIYQAIQKPQNEFFVSCFYEPEIQKNRDFFRFFSTVYA